jgi:hypothetical protein
MYNDNNIILFIILIHPFIVSTINNKYILIILTFITLFYKIII